MKRFLTAQVVVYLGTAAFALALAGETERMLVVYLGIAMTCWTLHSAAAAGAFVLLVRASLDDGAAWRASPKAMGVIVAYAAVASLALVLALGGASRSDALVGCALAAGTTVFVLRACLRGEFAGRCAHCRYDLRGTIGSRVCPECGRKPLPAAAPSENS